MTQLPSAAQYEKDYTPLPKTSPGNKALIQELSTPDLSEIAGIRSLDKRNQMTAAFDQIVRSLIGKVKKGEFIDDDATQQYVDLIFNTIIQNNHLPERKRRLLVSRDMIANAVCYGEGTFVVTMGLLNKSENESQVAFALAHELAHYELNHVFKKVKQNVEKRTTRNISKKATNILFDDQANTKDLEDLRELVYTETRFSRHLESQADSLAAVYLKNTPYNLVEGIRELMVLDSALYPRYELGDQWFRAFQFSKYPFQNYWLKPKLSVYSAKQDRAFIFAMDSLHSHPEMAARIAALPSLAFDNRPVNHQPDQLVKAISIGAGFECVQTAYDQKQFDLCLYYSLQLLSVYPENSFLTTKIGAMLLRMYIAKEYATNSTFIQDYTAYYPPQLKQVNAFLYNLRKEELGELAYHFLNTRPHFNPNVEMHYYLLWRVCKNTQRTDVQEKIELAYKTKFDKKISSFPDPFQTDVPRTQLIHKPYGF